MKRFDSKLKISVSLVALMCGGGLASSPTLAMTYDGDETGVVIGSDVPDLIVTSTGSITPDGVLVSADIAGNLTNAGLIEAVVIETDGGADATALDVNGTVGGNVVNNKIVNAEAKGAAEVTATAGFHDNSENIWGSATGLEISTVTGNITNTGVISALGTADLVYNIGTVATPAADVTVEVWSYGYASGLWASTANGTLTNAAGASITADASSDGTFNIVADGGHVEPDLQWGSVSATATGVYLGGGTHSVSNSGTISANSSADMVVNGTATATTDSALMDVHAEVSAYAYGVLSYGTTNGFTNAGTITAAAASSVSETLSATGTSGKMVVTNTVTASATSIYIADLQGNFSNSGTVSATAASDLSLIADVTGTAGDAYLEVDDYIWAYAVAVEINSMTGSFSNTSALSITATADSNAVYDLSAVGDQGAQINLQGALVPSAEATGVLIRGGEYSLNNSGTISATANADLSVTALASGLATEASITGAFTVDAYAYGTWLSGTVTGFTNSGTITAAASAKAVEDLSAHAATGVSRLWVNDNDISATAQGVRINNTLEGAFSNTGTISATASTSLTITADAVSGASRAWASINNDDVTASATGVRISTLDGSFTNGGTISATANTLVSETVSAAGDQATASIDNADYSASALAVYILGGEYSLTNTGTISANASTTFTGSVTATAALSQAYVWNENSDSAYAYGLLGYGTLTGFTNGGSISATASTSSIADAVANGASTATASMSNNVWASAFGVYLNTVEGDVTNNGTISATVSTSLTAKQSSTATDSSAYIWASDDMWGSAYGLEVNNLTGTLKNDSTGVISATVDGIMAHDLSASGASATVSLTSLSQSAYAWGVLVDGGEYNLVNSGSITADASVAATIKASAVGSEFGAYAYLSEVSQTVSAYGVYADGTVTGVDNSGTISATAAASLVETVSAKGGTSASVSISNTVEVFAYGIFVEDPLEGDISNTGTISATASGVIDVTASASFGAEAGVVEVHNWAEVVAVGVSANFAAPGEKEDPRVFDNSKTITATALLSVNTVVPASTDPVPTVETDADVAAYGAFLTGSLGVVSNSGTISASVEAANVDEALAIGVFLPEGAEGLEITNSGTLSASVKGTAESATAVALQVGPLEAPTETSELEPTAVGVITITNTGTISATNEAGGAYGIFAGFAEDPLVINQLGGDISAATAIEIENGNADTLNWSGGSIKGLVSADGADVVNVLQAVKDGKGVATTVTAGTDFALDGAGQLNIGGGKGAPVTFDFAGLATNVGATTVATDASLVIEPTGEIHGNTFTMQPDSKLTFVFNPTEAGVISMTGDATIDGTLGAVALPGLYGDKGSHVVVESDTKVVGTFDNTAITGDTLLIDFTAAVHEQDVTISWERTPFNEVAGLTINSTSVATALEDGYDPTRPASKNDPELNDILAGLFTLTDAETYDRVLNSWSGSEHAQVMRAAANLSEPYLMTIGEHLNDIRRAGAPDGQVVMLRPKGSSASIAPLSAAGASAEEHRFAFWGRAFGRWSDTRGDIEADGYDEDTYGAVLGVDFIVSPNVTVGIAGGYTDDDIDFDDGDAGKIKRWTIGGYLSAQFDGFYIDGSLSYASDDYRVERTIVYGDTSCLAFNCTTGAASKYDGDGFLGHAEIGYIFAVGEGIGLQPFAGINYSSVDSDPFAETGGGDLGLEVLDGTGKSLQSRLGARLTGEWGSGETRWFPELRVEWRHEFEDDPAWIVASLNGLPDEPFTAIGSKVTSDLAVVGAGVTAVMSNGVGIFLDYQGAFGSGYSGHVIQGGVRLKF